MSIYKRSNSTLWWIQFTAADGRRIRKSSGTEDRQAAQELHDRLKAESWRAKHTKDRPRRTWQDAVTRWLTEQSQKRSIDADKMHLRWLHQHLYGLQVSDITRDRLDEVRQARLATGVSPTTVNRMLEIVRAILRRAEREWEWIERAPHVRMISTDTTRVRWLTRDEAERLLRELPEHLADMAKFSLATGLRESNVTGLRWENVDTDRRCAWVHGSEAKGRRSFSVPLNEDAMWCIHRQIGKHPTHVFTFDGHPVTKANNHAWRKALKRAGIEDFRWHDLRHTWASWHVMAGTPLHVIQQLGAWRSLDMVLRYAHLSPGHLAQHAASVTIPTQAVVVTFPAQLSSKSR